MSSHHVSCFYCCNDEYRIHFGTTPSNKCTCIAAVPSVLNRPLKACLRLLQAITIATTAASTNTLATQQHKMCSPQAASATITAYKHFGIHLLKNVLAAAASSTTTTTVATATTVGVLANPTSSQSVLLQQLRHHLVQFGKPATQSTGGFNFGATTANKPQSNSSGFLWCTRYSTHKWRIHLRCSSKPKHLVSSNSSSGSTAASVFGQTTTTTSPQLQFW